MARSELHGGIIKWAKDILLFVHDVFPDCVLSEQQKKFFLILQALVWAKIKVNSYLLKGGKPPPGISEEIKELSRKFGISVMSGVGTGKGACAAITVIWFLTCFPYPKIVCVGPSAKQIRDNLWSEISKWHTKSKLEDLFVWQSDRFFLKELEGKRWFASARTANARNSPDEQAETLAGIHEDYVLIIGDESSGIPDPVFRPLESTLTRLCNLALLFFNPTRGQGFAFDTQHKNRSDWIPFRWNAEESSIVSRESIERLEKKYGRESNSFRIRVLGLPPVSGDNEIIPWAWIENAVDREVEPLDTDRLCFSLDVGAGGDDSVLLKKIGPKVLDPLSVVNYNESEKVVDWAVRAALANEPRAFFIDPIGWGWGVAGSIQKRLEGQNCDVVQVNVSETAFDDSRFYRLRDELWWRMRESFEKGVVSIPDDAILKGDLNSPKYDEKSGVVKVESKQDMRRRGVESPNRADSLMMTYYYEADFMRRVFQHKKNSKTKERTRSWRVA